MACRWSLFVRASAAFATLGYSSGGALSGHLTPQPKEYLDEEVAGVNCRRGLLRDYLQE
jgi:hypothetical protein